MIPELAGAVLVDGTLGVEPDNNVLLVNLLVLKIEGVGFVVSMALVDVALLVDRSDLEDRATPVVQDNFVEFDVLENLLDVAVFGAFDSVLARTLLIVTDDDLADVCALLFFVVVVAEIEGGSKHLHPCIICGTVMAEIGVEDCHLRRRISSLQLDCEH